MCNDCLVYCAVQSTVKRTRDDAMLTMQIVYTSVFFPMRDTIESRVVLLDLASCAPNGVLDVFHPASASWGMLHVIDKTEMQIV